MYSEQIEQISQCRHVNVSTDILHNTQNEEESNSEQSDHDGEVASEAETNGQPAQQSS